MNIRMIAATLLLSTEPLLAAGQYPSSTFNDITLVTPLSKASGGLGNSTGALDGFTVGGIPLGSQNGVTNASGLTTTTTGSITATQSILTLSAANGFVNGQGVRVDHVGPTFSLTAPVGLTGTAQGVTGSTTYTYTVACLDNNGGVGKSVANYSITNGNNSGLSSSNYNVIAWSNVGSCPMFAVYGRTAGALSLVGITPSNTWADYGVSGWTNVDYGTTNTWYRPDWLPAAPQTSAALNDYLLTTVLGGGGTTTLTLAASASNTVSGGNVAHDDTAAINTAITACGTLACQIDFAPGHYPITSTIQLGNGGETGTTPSTVNGILLNARAARMAANGVNSQIFGVSLEYQGYGNAVQVNGPTSGMGMNNIGINMVTGSTVSDGLLLRCSTFGQFRGTTILNAPSQAIRHESSNAATASCSDFQNHFEDTYIYLAPAAYGATGISAAALTGPATAQTDAFNSVYVNTIIQPTNYGSAQTCLYAGAADTFIFYKFDCNPINTGNLSHVVTGVLFDYSNGVSTAWPDSFRFYDAELWKNPVLNNGTPNTVVAWYNAFYGLSMSNGGSLPTVSNVYASNGPFATAGAPPTVSGSCSPSAATGSAMSGTFTLGSTCTGGTVTLGFVTTAPTGWFCRGNNYGTAVVVTGQNAATNGANIYIANGAAGNVISYECTPR